MNIEIYKVPVIEKCFISKNSKFERFEYESYTLRVENTCYFLISN